MDFIHEMNTFDLFFGFIVLVSMLLSLWRGLIKEALAITFWVLALFLSIKYTKFLAVIIDPSLAHPLVISVASFFIIFIATLLLGAIVKKIMHSLVNITGLTFTDRLLGLGFGALRGLVIVAVLILVGKLTPLPGSDVWQQSQSIAYLEPVMAEIMAKEVDSA